MSISKISTAAVLGLAVMAATPAAAEPAEETQDFLTAAGVGVVDTVGNSDAADRHLFDTGERPTQHWVYDADTGELVERDADTAVAANERVDGPALDFGIDVL